MSSFFERGRNCWRIEHADKVRFVIDAADYFRFLRETLKQAEKAVYLLCWDIDSRIELVRDETDDGYPTRLGDFLNRLVKEKPHLNIYIMDWDFAVLYTFDRELLPIYKLGWKTPGRIHFRLDNYHPEGASQHQKIVVIDDTVAFIGGLDLTRGRWDTSDHIPDDPRRDRIESEITRPYHDVQIMLAGDAARALGDLARDRWRKLTGDSLSPPKPRRPEKVWPGDIPPDLKDVLTGLSRTQAAFKEQQDVREIERCYGDAILSARNFIYIENQFFTAPAIGEALLAQLKKENGPEIVIVTPRQTDGWLPQHTMDVLRIRLIRRLQAYDQHQRLRVYFPDGPGLNDKPINVHAKVMIVDDRLATVGSANLNNRSMGLDNECNIFIEAGNDKSVAAGIMDFRHRLLADHLGSRPGRIRRIVEEEKSLIGCIEKLNDPAKKFLNRLPLDLSPELDRLVPDTELLDPEHPIKPELMIRHIVPEGYQKTTRSRVVTWVMLIAVVVGLSAMWRWTPLSQWIDIETLSGVVESAREVPAAPAWVILGFVLAGLVAFPFSLLIVVTVITYGPVAGFIYSLTGGTLSAIAVYWIGDRLGRNFVRKLGGGKINRISRKIARHGIVNIIFVRIVPVAPFTLINLVAGASHINFRDYTLGTLLGFIPGMLAVTLLADRVEATIREPDPGNTVWLVVTAMAVFAAAYLLIKWLKRRSGKETATG